MGNTEIKIVKLISEGRGYLVNNSLSFLIKDSIEIKTVKLIAEGRGYLVNNTVSFLIKDNNELLTYVNEWIKNGGLVEPEFTSEELTARELNEKLSTAKQYLKETDWVNNYKLRHDLGLELILETSSKWLIINKRTEYITFLKGI